MVEVGCDAFRVYASPFVQEETKKEEKNGAKRSMEGRSLRDETKKASPAEQVISSTPRARRVGQR
jgi:hypothetical protein